MMRPGLLVGLLLSLPAPILACSFCPGPSATLGEEMDQAKLVFFGKAISSHFAQGDAANGSTNFRIERILRDDPLLANKQALTLPRYVPVTDPKDPPQFLVFCDIRKDKLDPYLGKSVKSDAVVDYLLKARPLRARKDMPARIAALQYYFQFLEHADETIARDAYLEFAKATDEEIGQLGQHLNPARLRELLESSKTSPESIGLLGFLLGSAGRQSDADFLRQRAMRASQSGQTSFDGLLSGYIALKPAEGWELLRANLLDAKKTFPVRFAAVQALRFSYNLKPEQHRANVLRSLQAIIPDGELADFAIEDLRRWKLWDHTADVLAQFGKKSHDVPIIRRAIVRYALCCPNTAAREFIKTLRARDAELVKDVEETLDLK